MNFLRLHPALEIDYKFKNFTLSVERMRRAQIFTITPDQILFVSFQNVHGVKISLRFSNRHEEEKLIRRAETLSSLESNSISSGRTDDTIVDIDHNVDSGYNCEYLSILSPPQSENVKPLSNLSVLTKEGVVNT